MCKELRACQASGEDGDFIKPRSVHKGKRSVMGDNTTTTNGVVERPFMRPKLRRRNSYGLWEEKERILNTLGNHRVTVLRSAPGSGKSSILPVLAHSGRGTRVFVIVPSSSLVRATRRSITQVLKNQSVRLSVQYVEYADSVYTHPSDIQVMGYEVAIGANLPAHLRSGDVVILDEIDAWQPFQVGLLGALFLNILTQETSGDQDFRVVLTSATLRLEDTTRWCQALLGPDHSVGVLDLCGELPRSQPPLLILPIRETLIRIDEWLTRTFSSGALVEELSLYTKQTLYCVAEGYPVVLLIVPGEAQAKQIAAELQSCKDLAESEQLGGFREYDICCVYADVDRDDVERNLAAAEKKRIIIGTDVIGVGHTFEYPVSEVNRGIAVIDSLTKYVVRVSELMPVIQEVTISSGEILQRQSRAKKAGHPGIWMCGNERIIEGSAPDDVVGTHLMDGEPSVLTSDLTMLVLILGAHGYDLRKMPLMHDSPELHRQIKNAFDSLVFFGCIRPEGSLTALGRAVVMLGTELRAALVAIEAMIRWPHLTERALLVSSIIATGPIIRRHQNADRPVFSFKVPSSDLLSQELLLHQALSLAGPGLKEFCLKNGLNRSDVKKAIRCAKSLNRRAKTLLGSSVFEALKEHYEASSCPFAQGQGMAYDDNDALRWAIFIGMRDNIVGWIERSPDMVEDFRPAEDHVEPEPFCLQWHFGQSTGPHRVLKVDERLSLTVSGPKSDDTPDPILYVGNVVDHLGKLTFSQGTSIDPQWLIHISPWRDRVVSLPLDRVSVSNGAIVRSSGLVLDGRVISSTVHSQQSASLSEMVQTLLEWCHARDTRLEYVTKRTNLFQVWVRHCALYDLGRTELLKTGFSKTGSWAAALKVRDLQEDLVDNNGAGASKDYGCIIFWHILEQVTALDFVEMLDLGQVPDRIQLAAWITAAYEEKDGRALSVWARYLLIPEMFYCRLSDSENPVITWDVVLTD